ncbi:hypothetical protein AYO45_05575 [Gammaproteobacteria bacterium SCGC AG-212-F23]|nr:hypothetical protein AYO45_05575 [Gammaproteobacteria bacterium SCGC AG-212-F23]
MILASGNEMTVDLSGDQLFYFGDNRKNTPQGITHSGTIVANGGRILLTVQNAQTVLDNAINVTGVLQAQSVMQKSGEIILSADPTATVTVSGKLDVSGDKGGVIKVLGGGINLLGARLDANGDHGGGEILIGGNAHGEGFEPHAKNITIDDKTLLSADALTLGQGGKIVAWSDGYTQAYGNFSARGGLQGGDGGFVETSGNSLTIQGVQVNTAAPQGKSGLWLLDPAAVTIKNNGGTNVAMTLSNGVYSPNNGFETTTLDVSNLVSALNSSNITVITQNTGSVGAGSITVANAVLWTSGNMLTLNSTGTIAINADVSSSGGGSLVLTAPSGVSIANTLGANGTLGSLTVTGATTITGSSIQTSGNQTYNSAVTVGATTTLTGGGSSTISFANGISGANTLNLSGANQYNLSGTIANTNVNVSGGGSNNTLTVNSGSATQNWTINGSNSGSLSVGGSFNFSGIQNLSSTASTSNFTFSGGSLSSITASGTKNLSFTTPVTVQMSSATTGSVVGVLPSFSGVTNVNGSGMTLQFLGNLLYQLLFTGGGAATLNNGIAFTGIAALIGNGSTVGTFASGLSPTFTTNSFTLNGVQTTFTNVFFPGFGGGAGGFVLLSDGTLVNVPSVLSQMTTPPTSTTASNTPSATTSSNLLLSGQVQQNVNQMTQQVQTDLNQNFQQTTLTGCA